MRTLACMQTLVNRVVLAVDRQNRYTVSLCRFSDDSSGHDQDFLVGQSDGLAMFDRCKRGLETIGSRRSAQDYVDVRMCRNRDEPFAPRRRDNRTGYTRLAKSADGRIRGHCDDLWLIPNDLLRHPPGILPGSQAHNPQLPGMRINDGQRTPAD
jgi:hypothetical protein